MTISDLIQIILMGLLVVVTGIYAWRTHVISKASKEQVSASVKMAEEMKEQAEATRRQADASVRMAEEMRNARSPSITMQWGSADPNNRKIPANIKNQGFGPALNLICYLTHQEFVFTHKSDAYTTFDVGQEYKLSLKSEKFDFDKWNGLAINCDYDSVLGEKFRSTLICESKEKRTLKITKLNSEDKP